jgi:MFS family permease
MVAISVYWFALNFHWTVLLTLLVPAQVYGLLLFEAPAGSLAARAQWAAGHEGLTLAMVIAPGLLVALLGNPLFGLLSDRDRSRFGRRRPYIFWGTLLNTGGLAVMAVGPLLVGRGGSGNPLAPSLLTLMGGLMIAQVGNNAAAAPFHALLPDIVPPEQRGTASGVMGLANMLGVVCGAIVGLVFPFNTHLLSTGAQSFASFWQSALSAYAVVGVVIVALGLATIALVRERPWTPPAETAEARAESGRVWRNLGLTVAATLAVGGGGLALLGVTPGLRLDENTLGVLNLLVIVVAGVGGAWAFGFRPRRAPDFSWVVLTRMLMMAGIYIVQTFLDYYMKDVAHAPAPEAATAIFLLILTVTATLSTFFAGWASDRIGRKRMVYLSGAFMAVVGAAFIFAPYLLPTNILLIANISAAIFGLGYGAYIAVDWALVADTLPSHDTYARDMGVWNIGQTVPQTFASVFGGWLLALGVALGNLSLGYTLLFGWFVLFCVLGTVTIRNIRGVAR